MSGGLHCRTEEGKSAGKRNRRLAAIDDPHAIDTTEWSQPRRPGPTRPAMFLGPLLTCLQWYAMPVANTGKVPHEAGPGSKGLKEEERNRNRKQTGTGGRTSYRVSRPTFHRPQCLGPKPSNVHDASSHIGN